MVRQDRWDEEAEVVVVGYGGAGAVTAITAHDAGAKVLVLEKQPSDTPTRTNHTPSSRTSGGGWWCPEDKEKAITYMEGLARISNEFLDDERKKMIAVFRGGLSPIIITLSICLGFTFGLVPGWTGVPAPALAPVVEAVGPAAVVVQVLATRLSHCRMDTLWLRRAFPRALRALACSADS